MATPEAFGVTLDGPYFGPGRWVSPLNYLPEVRAQMRLPPRVTVHDVTLRDGEQTARVAFTVDEKLFLAQEMDKIGIPSFEPGLPATEEDREVIRTLVQMKLRARVTPLVRVREDDLEAALACGAPGMVLEFGINPFLIKYAYNMTPEQLVEKVVALSRRAKDEGGMYVEFMGWDTFRIPSLDYVKRFFGEILERGAVDRITVSDTFGMAHPLAMRFLITRLREWFPDTPLGLHIHNDYGQATASALMAIASGVDEVHCSVNGLGERAGNVATEEVIVACEHLLGVPTGVRLEGLYRLSQMVAEISKIRPASNKPIVGSGLFEVESGIVIHILRQFRATPLGELALFPYPPELVGREGPTLVAGRGTGRNYVEMTLEELGLEATTAQAEEIVRRVKSVALRLKNALPAAVYHGIIREVLGAGTTASRDGTSASR
jgi:2-isopropylmalate synthase